MHLNLLLVDTAEKIMTGNSNGTVALYDIGKGGSKLERLKTHHQSGRAINVISFAGPSGQGTLLASGCQDGDIKLSVSLAISCEERLDLILEGSRTCDTLR